MSKFQKAPVTIEASQWQKNGDHPLDASELMAEKGNPENLFLSEGKVVRYFRHPNVPGEKVCSDCGVIMHEHGWIDTLEGGHVVCPGDWIITGVEGEHYPCKARIFKKTYFAVDGGE